MLDYRFPHRWPSVWCLQLVSVNPPHKKSETLMSFFMFVLTSWVFFFKRAVEQTMEMQVGREFMNLILCYFYIIYYSVIDDITGLVCGATTGHQWFPIARDHWNGALVVPCAAFPSSVDSPQKVGLMFSFMFACTSCSTNSRGSIELKCHDAYASLLCVNLTVPMVDHPDNYVTIILKV